MDKFTRCIALLFLAAGFDATATVTPLPGTSPQTVSKGDNLAPLRVLVTDAAGNPMPNYTVRWNLAFALAGPRGILAHDDHSNCTPDLGYNCRVKTNAQGVAQLNATHAIAPGSVAIPVIAGEGEADYLGRASLEVGVLDRSIPPGASLQGTWWGGPEENGWGVTIAQPLPGDRLLMTVIFAYDETGRPTWQAIDQFGFTAPGRGEGRVYSPRGSPYFGYDVKRFDPGPPQERALMEFHSDSRATLRLVAPEGGAVTRKAIRAFDIEGDHYPYAERFTGLWWGGPSQAGWAISFAGGGGGLHGLWLTYDENGERTWFSMPSPTWQGNVYEGTIYRTRGPSWPNYDPSELVAEPVGRFHVLFEDENNATFGWGIGVHLQQIHIQRYAP